MQISSQPHNRNLHYEKNANEERFEKRLQESLQRERLQERDFCSNIIAVGSSHLCFWCAEQTFSHWSKKYLKPPISRKRPNPKYVHSFRFLSIPFMIDPTTDSTILVAGGTKKPDRQTEGSIVSLYKSVRLGHI